jgi:hypothetical protein
MAEATIVSWVPRRIREFKPGLATEYVEIPAAELNDYVVVVVGDNKSSIYLDSDRGSRPFPVPVEEFAESIVQDFKLAQIERSTESGAEPGIFWVPGRLTKEQVKTQHGEKLASSLKSQILWFERLVRKANDDWHQTHQMNRIAEIQRIAARTLKLSPEWLYEDSAMHNNSCPACGSIVANPMPAVCPNCRCILDETKHKSLKFATTG